MEYSVLVHCMYVPYSGQVRVFNIYLSITTLFLEASSSDLVVDCEL